jgi:O-antigen/teichoic acid export membrane protein
MTPPGTIQDKPLSSKMMRGASFGVLRVILIAPIPFILTPLILHRIGSSGYGTWAVFVAMNGLTSLADLGLVGTLSKFVAEYYAQRDFASLARVLNSGLAVFLFLTIVISALFWWTGPFLIKVLFRGSKVSSLELLVLLHCFLVVITANILTLLFSSVTTGLQRLDLTYTLGASNTFLGALFGGTLLVQGWGIRGLVYGCMLSGVLTVLAYVLLVHRLLPGFVLNPFRFDKEEARKMFGFSLRLYLTQAAVAVHNQVEKVFLALLVGVASVGWYDIASDLALKVRAAVGCILSPVLPAASELSALQDERRLRELYYRAHKYLALVGVPAVTFIVAISSRFVELWIGPSLRLVALPLCILVFVNFFNLTTGPGYLIFAGRGNLRPGVQSAILGIVLNVFLSLVLIYKFGFAGAVLGTSASLLVASAFFVTVFHRQTGYSFSRLLAEAYLKPTLASICVLAALLAVYSTKELSWLQLVEMGFGFALLYSIVILLSRFLDTYDWSKIENFVPAARYIRRINWIA